MKIVWPILSEGLHPIRWMNNDSTPPPLGGVDGALEFYAATIDTDAFYMLGTEIGTSVAQVSTGLLWTPDFEGVAWEGTSQEPAYKGGRFVRNECTYSEDFTQSGTWTKYDTGDGIVPIITGDYTTDDDGKLVDRCQFRAGSGNYSMLHYRFIGNDTETGIAQIRCKSNTGSNQRVHFKTQGNSQNCITVTPEWQIFYVNETISTATFGARYEAANGEDIDILVDYFQIEVSEGRTDETTPSEYVEKMGGQVEEYFATLNGNVTTVDATHGNTVVYGVGDFIENGPYLVVRGFSNEALTTPANKQVDWFSSNHSNTHGPYTMEFDLTGDDIANLVDVDAVPILSLASDVLTLTDGTNTVTKACTAGERKIGILFEQGEGGADGTMQLSVDGELSDVADWVNTWGDGRFGIGADVREVERWDQETLAAQRALL